MEGELLDGSLKPSTETPMHTGIYRARQQVDEVATKIAGYGQAKPPSADTE